MSQPVSAEQADVAHLPDARGAAVFRVLPGSPADKAGLKADDIIVGIDGKEVDDPAALRNKAFTLTVGSEVPVAYLRGGEARTAKVVISEMPADPVVTFFGVTVKQVPRDESGVLAIDQVVPGSLATRPG